MLKAILRSLRTGVVTIHYPAQLAQPPARFRGAPQVRPAVRSTRSSRRRSALRRHHRGAG